MAKPVFQRTQSDREALYLRSLADDLQHDGCARCAEVATWLAAARAYRAPLAAPKAPRPQKRSDREHAPLVHKFSLDELCEEFKWFRLCLAQ